MVIFDLAQIGPDYLPSHGHADTLSFELSVYGKRVFVNSGTSMYGTEKKDYASEELLTIQPYKWARFI